MLLNSSSLCEIPPHFTDEKSEAAQKRIDSSKAGSQWGELQTQTIQGPCF